MKNVIAILLIVFGLMFVGYSVLEKSFIKYSANIKIESDSAELDMDAESKMLDKPRYSQVEEEISLKYILDYIKEILGSLSSISGVAMLIINRKKKK